MKARLMDRGGAALVFTLMALALITALVVEFAYGVYLNTGRLRNWQTAQRLSLTANSGASLAAWLIKEASKKDYTHPGVFYLPPTDPFNPSDASGADSGLVSIRIVDENAKFNLNSVVYENGGLNEESYRAFRRLLRALSLDEEIAERAADWMDKDSIARLPGSEQRAANAPFETADEMLLLEGLPEGAYETLSPYVTVYGGGLININSAEWPVLMSLSDSITREMAERVVGYRDLRAFEKTGQITKVAGFEALGISLMGKITVKGGAFKTTSAASSADGILRVVDCVLDPSGVIKYWKEY